MALLQKNAAMYLNTPIKINFCDDKELYWEFNVYASRKHIIIKVCSYIDMNEFGNKTNAISKKCYMLLSTYLNINV